MKTLTVPSKNELLKSYNQAEFYGKLFVMFDLAAAAVCLKYLDYAFFETQQAEVAIVIGLAVLPTLLSLAYVFGRNKKKIEDLRQDVQFGKLRKADIIEVCQTVSQRMKVNYNDVTFYVTAEKQINAGALSLGLGLLSNSLRVVFLNRATLHALRKDELMSVVAHELAHIYRYPLIFYQALLIRLACAAVFYVTLLSVLHNVIIVALIVGVYQGIASNFFSRYSTTIEFLCDDTGAEVAGLEAALRAEYLIGKHAEVLSDAYYLLLKAKVEGSSVSSRSIVQMLEDSMTFDGMSSEELQKQLEAKLHEQEVKASSSFFEHFKAQVFGDSHEGERVIKEELESLELARKIPRLEFHGGEQSALTMADFKQLVVNLREDPSKPLFRIPSDLDDTGESHPGPRRRILYLWQEFAKT